MHRGGLSIDTPRLARHAIARNSRSALPRVKTQYQEFNTTLAQRGLRARGRNWVEGRIAECPRLQQKPSDLLITELAVIVGYSSPSEE
jgi:hypothetical protein